MDHVLGDATKAQRLNRFKAGCGKVTADAEQWVSPGCSCMHAPPPPPCRRTGNGEECSVYLSSPDPAAVPIRPCIAKKGEHNSGMYVHTGT